MRLRVENFEEFEIVVDGNVTKVNVKTVCGIDGENLMEEFTKYPSTYAWYMTVAGLYESKKDDLEYRLKVVEADLEPSKRAVLKEEFGKDLKEKQVDSAVKSDKRWRVISEELLDIRKVVKRLHAVIKGLEVKKDMLVQVGSRDRKRLELDAMGR